jgi:hypothetical protein
MPAEDRDPAFGGIGARPDGASQRFLALSWDSDDRHRLASWLAMIGLVIVATMAVFGLPPVDLHGPLHRLGIMDPLCGGTRAARYTAQGNFPFAWKYNPLGILTVIAVAAIACRTALGLSIRRWLTVELRWTPRRMRWALAALTMALVALEIRQQFRADLLIAGT